MAKSSSPLAIPEPFTVRDALVFTVPGLVLFSVLFAFFFSLSSM
ncbi:MAG TPA: hypothetical protein VFW28_11485 [Micropepsaceae bacterium]|nr:hypothetical protein [Micropepsaceae bacterium]